jgi:hypothetical protein
VNSFRFSVFSFQRQPMEVANLTPTAAQAQRRRNRNVFAILALLMAVSAPPSYAAGQGKAKAEVMNTGSTNSPAYRIVISSSGHANYTVTGRRGVRGPSAANSSKATAVTLPASLTKKFFKDLGAAMPLSAMPAGQCAKSVSFGSSTYVIYRGETSPDITCPGDSKQQALLDDAQKILRLLSSAKTTGGPESPGPPTSHQVTIEDDNKTVEMKVGDTMVLHLGTDMDWTISQLDQSILKREIGVMPVRGSQGVFEVIKAGETQLQAAGNPPCRNATPPCEAPSRAFRVTFVVK